MIYINYGDKERNENDKRYTVISPAEGRVRQIS